MLQRTIPLGHEKLNFNITIDSYYKLPRHLYQI
jgi:hypothetical protein